MADQIKDLKIIAVDNGKNKSQIGFSLTTKDGKTHTVTDLEQAKKDKIINDTEYLMLVEFKYKIENYSYEKEPKVKETFVPSPIPEKKIPDFLPIIISSMALGIIGYLVFFNKAK